VSEKQQEEEEETAQFYESNQLDHMLFSPLSFQKERPDRKKIVSEIQDLDKEIIELQSTLLRAMQRQK